MGITGMLQLESEAVVDEPAPHVESDPRTEMLAQCLEVIEGLNSRVSELEVVTASQSEVIHEHIEVNRGRYKTLRERMGSFEYFTPELEELSARHENDLEGVLGIVRDLSREQTNTWNRMLYNERMDFKRHDAQSCQIEGQIEECSTEIGLNAARIKSLEAVIICLTIVVILLVMGVLAIFWNMP